MDSTDPPSSHLLAGKPRKNLGPSPFLADWQDGENGLGRTRLSVGLLRPDSASLSRVISQRPNPH